MKKVVSIFVVLAMLLSMVPAVFAEEVTEVYSQSELELSVTYNDYGETVAEPHEYSWTATADGVVTVNFTSVDPGVRFWFGENLPQNVTKAGSYEFTVTANTECYFKVIGYANWAECEATVSFDITFTPADIDSTVEQQEYVVSTQTLSLGENTVALEENTLNSLYEFAPNQAGVYEITADEGIQLGYWGTPSYPFDGTETKTNTLTYTLTNENQSILIGVVNGESTGNVTITVTKTGEAGETVLEAVPYENKATLSQFTLPEGATAGGYVDVYGDTHTAVLGDDGYYHLDSADGAILLVDMNYICVLTDVLNSDRPVMYAYVEEDGNTVKYDVAAAVQAYEAVCDENGYYPLTEDLMFFYQEYASDVGTYQFYLEEGYNPDCAWMFACLTMTLPEEEPEYGTILSGSGTEEDPYVISGLPFVMHLTATGDEYDMGVFYLYIPDQDGKMVVEGFEDGVNCGVLTEVNGWVHISDVGSYEFSAGDELLLNHWAIWAGEYELTLLYEEITADEGGDTGEDGGDTGEDGGDTGEDGGDDPVVEGNTSDNMTGSGTKDDPFIIDSLPITLVETLSAEAVNTGLYFQYTVSADGVLQAISDGNACITVETADGTFLANIHDEDLAVTEGTVLLLNLWGYDAGTLEITVQMAEAEEEPADTVLDLGDNYIELPAAEDEVSYTFTATESGWLYIIATYIGWDSNGTGSYSDDTEYLASDFESFCSLAVNGVVLENYYYGAVEVVAGETYTFTWTDICTWDSNQGWEATLNLSYDDALIPVLGGEDMPVELYMDDCPTDSVEIAAGATAYYNLNWFNGATFEVKGEGAYVLVYAMDNETYEYIWVRYDAVDGVVTVPVSDRVATVQIGNDGTEAAVFELDGYYPLGSQYEPQQVTGNGTYTAEVSANSEGYYFNWTAEEEGLLTITVNGQSWSYWVNNMYTGVSGDWHYSNDNPLVSSDTIAVFAGDVVEVVVNTLMDENTYESPAGEIEVTFTFVAQEIPLGSEYNPYIISYYDELPATVDVAAGEEVYVKLVGFTGFDVTVTGEGAYVICNGEKIEAVNGVVTIPVTDYSMLVYVGNAGTEDAQYSVDVLIPVGHEDNPEIITDMGEFTTPVFEAGTYDQYYYEWVATCNGTLTVVVANEDYWRLSIWNTSTYDSTSSNDNRGNNVLTLEVSAGDVIQIYGATFDLDMWSNVEGTLTFTVSFEATHLDEDGDRVCDLCGEEITVLLGDVNGDGVVNNKDLLRLQKYLLGADVEVVLENSDVNGDDSVTNRDLLRLQKYLLGAVESLG